MTQAPRHPMHYTGGPSGRPPLGVLAASIGPLVYFVRTQDDLVKIGHTTSLATRVNHFGGFSRILAVQAGSLADERQLHQKFCAHRARGAEYYHPAEELMAHIDSIRAALNLSPVERWR